MKSRSKSSLLVALLSSLILVLFNFGALAAGKVQSATSQAVIKYKAPEDAKPEKSGGRITVPATAKGIVKYKKGCGENMRLYRGNCICLGGLKLSMVFARRSRFQNRHPRLRSRRRNFRLGQLGRLIRILCWRPMGEHSPTDSAFQVEACHPV